MALSRNSLYNLGGVLLPTLVTLLTTPLYLRLIGEARYGVMALVWVVLSYFSLSDCGLGPALSRQIACRRDADNRALLQTALQASLALGLLAGVLLWLLAVLWGQYMAGELAGGLLDEVLAAAWLCIPMVPAMTCAAVLNGLLQGHERFATLNLCAAFAAVAALLLPLLLAWQGHIQLIWLLAGVLLARVLALLPALRAARQLVPGPWGGQFCRQELGGLLQVGGWLTLSNLLSVLMTTTDRMLIAAWQGVQALTWYSIPFNLLGKATLLPVAIMGALYPRLAAADEPGRRQLALDSLQGFGWLMLPPVLAGLCLLGPFLSLWLGDEFAARATRAGLLLLPGIWFNSVAQVPYYCLQAAGQTARLSRVHLLELPLYGLLLVAGLQLWGIEGAALAWTLRVLFDLLLLLRAAGLPAVAWQRMLWPLLAILLALLASLLLPLERSWPGLLLLVVLSSLHAARNLWQLWRRLR